MLTPAQRKEELKKHELKIAELRAELDRVNGQLSDATTKRETLFSDVASLEKRASELKDLIAKLVADAEGAAKEHGLRIERYTIENAKIVEKAADLKGAVFGALADEEEALRKRLATLRAEDKRLSKQVPKLEARAKATATAERRFALTQRKYAAELKQIEAERKQLAADRKDTRELILKNGQLVTASERNLRLIEHYAKRLQRHYDRMGTKIDVLAQFNIKRDRTK